jgi:hypothetical protein
VGAVRETLALGATETVARSLAPAWAAAFEVLLPLDDDASCTALEWEGSSERGGSEGGEGGAAAGSRSVSNAAGSAVEVRVLDKDRFGADDFLGACVLTFKDLVAGARGSSTAAAEVDKGLGPAPEDRAAAAAGRKAAKPATRSFEFFSCKYVDILPPKGRFVATCRPAALLELTLVGASGLAAANFDGQSDPYAKVGHHRVGMIHP